MIATCEPGLNGPLVAGVDVGGTKTSVVVIGATAIARHRIGLPEREGVDER